MARSFPTNFDLRLLGGPRAKQFTKPEDAFQQLMGDALKEMAGAYAHVYPTRGRDGSIDAFIIDGALLTGPFQDLPLPLIIECKTHDDAAKDVKRNILDQWTLMEGKLEANALAGWKDLFEPWLEARAYAYCLSSNFPHEHVRQKLTSAIGGFFSSLPLDYRPPVDAVRVIDWSDLIPWLSRSGRISDSWLGIELELILDHDTHLNRLSGFRQYLLPSHFEFVPPAEESSFHPTRILAEIGKVDTKHAVLLVGAGGVGKTRTAIEVGTLALNAGWRVLHILPDEPGVETEDIAEIVLPYNDSRTLLIFDYIDQMQRLDLGGIRRSLIPAAADRGIQLRLLANCRPGWMTISNPERDELFRVIELHPTDAHKATLIEIMASRIAPTACRILEKSVVIRLCGTRAIIALLIARELESRALANLLTDIDIASLRSGDLVQWLRRRLEENALSVKHNEPSLAPQRPAIPMVAAAAALACAPETRETLIFAAELAYRNMGWPTAQQDARFLVDLLLKFGWLEPHGIFDSTPHDVVADEVLDQTIRGEAVIFERELTAVLSCTLSIPRAIGRVATAIRRVFGSVKTQAVTESINEFLHSWLSVNAKALGEALQAGNPDLTSYALGALLSGPPWEEPAIAEWEKLFLPWLNAHSKKEEARHLLYKGLKSTDVPGGDLISVALTWLSAQGRIITATFVLRPLLAREGLSATEAEQTIRFSLQWLETHHHAFEAEFVFHALLERKDLEADEAKSARAFALKWLETHHHAFEAEFVLHPLLDRKDLEADEAKSTRAFALKWLESHHETLETGFVLHPLLNRNDLEADEAESARALALKWLEKHHETLNAQFVLHSLLDRKDLKGDDAMKAGGFALQWLALHHDGLDAQFVLQPLLERKDLESDNATKADGFAMQWLALHHDALDAQFVLPPLLGRDLEGDNATKACEFALQWLGQHSDVLEAGFVLPPLLDLLKMGSEGAVIAVSTSVKWLQTFYETIDAEFVLRKLFRRDDVPPSQQLSLMIAAIRRVREHLAREETNFLLRSCLQYRINNAPLQRELVSLAMEWLERHPGSPGGEYLWNRMLRYPHHLISNDDWANVARHALIWLKERGFGDAGVEQTVNSLLMRQDCLSARDTKSLAGRAIRLLRTDLHPQGRRNMVRSLGYLAGSLGDDDPLKRQIHEALDSR